MSFKYKKEDRDIIATMAIEFAEDLVEKVHQLNQSQLETGQAFGYQLKLRKQGGFELQVKTLEEIWDKKAEKYHQWAFDSLSNLAGQLPKEDEGQSWPEYFDEFAENWMLPTEKEEAAFRNIQNAWSVANKAATKEVEELTEKEKQKEENRKVSLIALEKRKERKAEKEAREKEMEESLANINKINEGAFDDEEYSEEDLAKEEDYLEIPASLDRRKEGSAS